MLAIEPADPDFPGRRFAVHSSRIARKLQSSEPGDPNGSAGSSARALKTRGRNFAVGEMTPMSPHGRIDQKDSAKRRSGSGVWN